MMLVKGFSVLVPQYFLLKKTLERMGSLWFHSASFFWSYPMSRSDSAITSLVEGFKQFKLKHFEQSEAYKGLVEDGQHPKTLVIACCDSRVDPAILTDSEPGELFVVRNVANLVPPYEADDRHHGTSAAIEYSILGLNVEHIVVIGHRYCGGIQALMQGDEGFEKTDFISSWMDVAATAKRTVVDQHPDSTFEELCLRCEKESLLVSLKNLETFPWVHERVKQGKLSLHAWYFDLASGDVEAYQRENSAFVKLT